MYSSDGCGRKTLVFSVDRGREMRNGEPALLKSRRYLRDAEVRKLWLELVRKGMGFNIIGLGGDVES